MVRSLRLRLAILSVVLVLVVLGVLWAAIGSLFIDNVIRQFRTEMDAVVESLAARVSVEDGQLTLEDPPGDPRFQSPSGGRYWQVDGAGGEKLRSRSLWDVDVDTATRPAFQAPPGSPFVRIEGPEGQMLLFLKRALKLDRDGHSYDMTVWTGFDEAEMIAPLDRHYQRSRLVMLTVAVLLLALVLAQPVIVLRPLLRLKAQIVEVRGGSRNRLSERVPSEVRPLVDEINLLLDEREAAVDRARARASDLAHGLKTPLTVLSQLFAQHLPPAERENALQQVELIRQRADRQLQSARLGVGAMGDSDVPKLVDKLVSVLKPVARERDIAWNVDVDPNLRLDVDPSDLVEALGNVLDNAVKWTRSQIAVRARAGENSVLISVADDGPGVPEEHRQTVLRRGKQLDEGRQGSGLGLAISCDVLEAYGGSLTLGSAPEGGLLVEMRFPYGAQRRLPSRPA